MAWDDVLAAIGGAAGGADNAHRFWANETQKEELAKLRQDLELFRIGETNFRAGQADATKRYGIDTTATTAAENRTARTADTLKRMELAWANLGQQGDIASARDATTRRGQDLTNELGWGRDATTRYGIDTTAGTTIRGQDLTAGTAARGQDVTQRGQDISATVQQRGQDVTATRPAANTNWWMDPNAAEPPANRYTTQPPARLPVPIAPRGGPPAAPAPPVAAPPGAPAAPAPPTTPAPPAAGAAPARTFTAGARLRLKDGRTITLTPAQADELTRTGSFTP